MIEAPEAVNLAAQLNKTVKGKRITVAMAGFTPHKFTFFTDTPERHEEMLIDKTVGNSHAYGGMVEIEIEDMRLLFNDGVNLTYYAPGFKLPAKHQLLLGFNDESCLIVSVRMYGGISCYPQGKLESGLKEYFETARTKPQVLSDDFTREYFMSLINDESAQKKSAKALLATEQTIPGLGNGVLQDILYNAGIHPKTKVKDIPADKREKLYGALCATLSEMAAKNGRSSESDLFGISGGYISWLSKDTAGQPCTRCGSIITKENYMGGSIYYCNGCQK